TPFTNGLTARKCRPTSSDACGSFSLPRWILGSKLAEPGWTASRSRNAGKTSRPCPNCMKPPHTAHLPAEPAEVSLPHARPNTIPRPGLLVTVRNRRGIIGTVQPFQHRNAGGVFHLVRVDYSDLDGPAEDQLVWELEPHARLVQPRQTPSPDADT